MTALAVSFAAAFLAAVSVPPVEPESAEGTFVQRKILSDVGVTLVSSGTYSFRKGKSFVWRTEKPVRSVFSATPTNYAVTAAGRTSVRPLNVDVTSFAKIFEIKEVKEFIQDIKVTGEPVPNRIDVFFKNGDRIEIDLDSAR